MNKVVIIHLSDIHFNKSEESNKLIDNLIKDLEYMKSEVNKYDLLAITGDCIDKGKVGLFDEFSEKVNMILKTCEIKKNHRTIIVPGNHDVSQENMWFKSLKMSCKDNSNIYKTIEQDFSPIFKEFNECVEKFGSLSNGIGVKYFNCNGLILRAIFLNSSWSTLINKNYGELLIGQSQLDEIKREIGSRKKKYDLSIACIHHPLDWFTYNDRVKLQDFLYNTLKIDFLFHGHIHEASYDTVTNMDMATSIFCTGISYHKTGETCSRKDGMRYSIYEIDKDTNTVNVYLRTTNNKGEFTWDNRLYSKVNKGGFFTIPIGNVTECLLPIKGVNPNFKNSIFTSRELVELLMHKEENLFRYYCKMESVLEQLLSDSKKEEYEKHWKKSIGKGKLSNKEKKQCEKEFYREQFEIYCMFLLNDLNALFFKNHKNVRFLLRRYDPKTNQHAAVLAEGIRSTTEETNKVKNFTWGEGMIYNSYKCKSALLMSNNLDYHKDGNTKGIWKEYLTIAIDGIVVKKLGELIPLFAVNIATESLENERCLQALAISSIYDKMSEVFKLFQVKGFDLIELYDLH